MERRRREFLTIVGVAGLSTIAGCSTSDNNNEEDTPSEWSQSSKLTANDGDKEDLFGSSVELSGDGTTALVGAREDTTEAGDATGSAYVFSHTGDSWRQQTKLTPDDGTENASFARSVSITDDGATAAIGGQGSAYVFERTDDSWGQRAKLTPADTDGAEMDFGVAVDMSADGTTVFVGAQNDDNENGDLAGSAYVFTRSSGSWSEQTKLLSSDGAAGDGFGIGVGLSDDGTTAIIGASTHDEPNGREAGAAYVFDGAGESWSETAKVSAADGDTSDVFGRSVAISGDGTTAVIGARQDEDPNGGFASGSAYIFTRSDESWSQQAKVVPEDGNSSAIYGNSVSISSNGTTALIGAPGQINSTDESKGAAYRFERKDGSWSRRQKLLAADGDARDAFGHSVSLSDGASTALIGDQSDADPNGKQAGSAYVFE